MSSLPGAVFLAEQRTCLEVRSDGSLTAVGTAEQPISISATDPMQGFWKGIAFNDTMSSQNRLAHFTLDHAGSDYWSSPVSAPPPRDKADSRAPGGFDDS